MTQLHEMFDWSERSRKGLLLFIDEADAFLGRRSDEMSEGLRGALNALLFRTGDQSRDFMVVSTHHGQGPSQRGDVYQIEVQHSTLFPCTHTLHMGA